MNTNMAGVGARWTSRMAVLIVSATMALGGCASSGSTQTEASIQNCAVAGVIGATLVAVWEKLQNKQVKAGHVAAGAAAFCAIGVAATAIGRYMTPAQQAKQDEALKQASEKTVSPRQKGQPLDLTANSSTWSSEGTSGGAVPTGPVQKNADGSDCIPMKEFVVAKGGQRVEQEVLSCRVASGGFTRVIPKA